MAIGSSTGDGKTNLGEGSAIGDELAGGPVSVHGRRL